MTWTRTKSRSRSSLSLLRTGTNKFPKSVSRYFPHRSNFSDRPSQDVQDQAKTFCGLRICPELVQRGLTSTPAGDFESQSTLFHMNFNRTVENFHQTFNKIIVSCDGVARKLLWRRNVRDRGQSDVFVAARSEE